MELVALMQTLNNIKLLFISQHQIVLFDLVFEFWKRYNSIMIFVNHFEQNLTRYLFMMW